MNNSVFIARIFALCYLIVGAGFLVNRNAFKRVMEDFCKNAALVFFSGLFTLVIGVVLILTHNIWAGGWTVIITIIGWAALIKGIWLVVFPDSIAKFMRIYQKKEGLLVLHGLIALIFSVVLAYFGFFA